ncbi:MAG: type II toxin-antitoxin system Phd/YefM family antitoxin [Richelia sp. RM2_1_2]|nr:type II toxin-antitoxin system Phd/YefM family antitoxin [Richelia sp. SM2_1_7]NJM18608.1 type II toxin-antitoxin system Phd/YefM family antitoxin [Richelia sp. SM1_7_0]NJN07927.1 type II toxin-antitoxin system Phd/YefM family antitoxin [Richelia sp. RM1_1_1]NJO26708.1 type II toxin-antitoxin system Phd/YefM family antitoxin [Richelia sp. SL_2_1]NJO57084.1 type II toxin-antitoxin system Phd/YefM family antitoxin [Richelia sp. RM2_1_2]NJS16943.1 type II toxin-antitoxin system Phd/YefM family
MKITNIHEAKTNLSKLIEAVLAGEEVIIAKAGKPAIRMIPYQKKKELRIPGGWEGKVTMSDDFDDELPPEILAGFTGEESV